ncbi:MAG: ATP-binding protein [Deltaproteobacteria bacterium]|nr:ATP-binding protein [Deltaproteobacteria bacterium]
MDYYAQGSLVAAVVALAIAVYLRVWARGDKEACAFAWLSFLIFLWCFPEYLWKTLDSSFWHRVSLVGVIFIPPFALRYCGMAVRTRPKWFSAAFVAGLWISAAFGATIFYGRALDSPWWNVAALLYVYPYLALGLHIIVRHGFRADPSSVERKKYQFLVVGGGIASLVAPLNFLPGLGIPFPPLAAFALLLFFYFMATGILHLHFFEFPDIVGRAIILVIQVFAFAVVFGVLEIASGRKFWFPLAGTFLVSFFILTFYPYLMRKLGGISSDLFVRESRRVQSLLSDCAKRFAECGSLPEIGRVVEEGLAQVPFVMKAALWIRPEGGTDEGIGSLPVRTEEYLRAHARFAKRYPAIRFLEHGGSRAGQVAIWDDTWDASFPIFLREALAGVALFRWKEKTPSIREMELLIPFLSGIGLAVENVRQKQRIQRREHFATVGELAAGLAHEVRTPAGVIKGAAQYLCRDASPREREFLDIIVEEADRLNGVVTEFLEYARPENRAPRPVFLREPAERALSRLRREKGESLERIHVSLLGDDPGPRVDADPSEIERVTFNLLSNAVEAMPGGGTLTVRLGTSGGEATMSVEDTGTGIPESDRAQLFRPFFTTRERGVGMGLAICRRIVEDNGGSIAVESVPGRGSRFMVRLPAGGNG